MSGPVRAPARVVLIGSESTGKTELAEWLASEFGAPWSPEFAREHAEARGGSAALTEGDVEPIALGQRAGEDRAIAAAGDSGGALVLHDTDLLSTVVYATHYYGAASLPAWLRAAAAERRPAVYLLCDIDVAWHGDSVRDPAQDRATVQRAFTDALAQQPTLVVDIRGDRATRRAAARRAIEMLLDERRTTP